MNFLRICMIRYNFYSYEIHEKFIWTSYGVQINFLWIPYEMKSNLAIWIYMQFVWSSCELDIEGLMKFICYTHVILMKLTWGSKTVRMKYIWGSYEFRMIWTSCELHKNYMTSAQEVTWYYTWIWVLASLLCTSYEWASRSIIEFSLIMAHRPDNPGVL